MVAGLIVFFGIDIFVPLKWTGKPVLVLTILQGFNELNSVIFK